MTEADIWPEWANFKATDADGVVWVYESRPSEGDSEWRATGGRSEKLVLCPNWRNTLEVNPHKVAPNVTAAELLTALKALTLACGEPLSAKAPDWSTLSAAKRLVEKENGND